MSFKVGQIVRCVENEGNAKDKLVNGELYRIVKETGSSKGFIIVESLKKPGEYIHRGTFNAGWAVNRFRAL